MKEPSQEKARIRGQVLNLDVSVFGFVLNNRSQRFGVSLEMEMGQHDLTPLPLVPVRHSEILLLLGNCMFLRNSPKPSWQTLHSLLSRRRAAS